MNHYKLVIIGGGSAGLAAAAAAYDAGITDPENGILILERDREPGGILQQCIHNGFGLHRFGEELSGPSYAERWAKEVEKRGISCRLNSMVTHLSKDRVVEYVNAAEGVVSVQADAVILAMGCRERTRGALAIPGYRPAGVWTAGAAQRYLNLEGLRIGTRAFILGSGDIGLIMARRLTLEGAKVLGVAEIMPYSNGLPRNMKQCLEDFDIPLYLSHTITEIRGRDRLTGVTISQVDSRMQPIAGTEKDFDVDTLLLSVGLIPEMNLGEEAGIAIDPATKGAFVNEALETSVPGIFSCGNVLHVHDLVDYVSAEGEKAGRMAAGYLMHDLKEDHAVAIRAGSGVGALLPQTVRPSNVEKSQEISFRVRKESRNSTIDIYRDGVKLRSIKKLHLVPACMENITLTRAELEQAAGEIRLEIGGAV